MKNKLMLLAVLTLFATHAYSAENYEIKNDFSDLIKDPLTTKVSYEIEVLKNEKMLYSSTMTLENSFITPVFYLNTTGFKTNANEKVINFAKNDADKLSGNKENKEESIEQTQLRIAVHVSKNDKDMWSQLLIQQVELNKKEEVKIIKSLEDKPALQAESNPMANKFDNEIIIAHQNEKPILVNWNEFKFKIKSTIEK